MTNHSDLGRPREFELDVAARDATNVFWDRG
jgi:TetR/AcrR family transcriptional repressor of nem operon